MFDSLREFTEGIDPLWQWLAVMLAGAIPFIESYFAGPIGIIAGVAPALAIIAAIVGNTLSMALFVLFADRFRRWRGSADKPLTPRGEKFKRSFDRYGVAGVSLLGQTILPSQITATAMVAFGASRTRVLFWQTVSIILWGVAFGVLTALGVSVVAG